MALQRFLPVPNTKLVDDPTRDSVWRRWLEELANRISPLGTGTVTSVGLSLPTDVFNVTGSPVTSSGTLTVAFDNQTSNTFFAGPSTGAASTPAFRALVAADIPLATRGNNYYAAVHG